jgi:hypothetical protein
MNYKIAGRTLESLLGFNGYNFAPALAARLASVLFVVHDFFPQRAFAALAAIADRFFGPRAAARATPPLRPPNRPRATAWRFLGVTSGGSVFGACPVDSSMIRYASSFGSRGRVFERSGILPAWAKQSAVVKVN